MVFVVGYGSTVTITGTFLKTNNYKTFERAAKPIELTYTQAYTTKYGDKGRISTTSELAIRQ